MLWGKRETETSFADAVGAALFHSMPDPIHIVENGIIVECNPAFERVIGYRRSEIIGTAPERLSPEFQPCGRRSDEYAGEVIGKVLRDGYNRFEWVHQTRDDTPLPVMATLILARAQGRDVIICVLQDQGKFVQVIQNLSDGLNALAAGDLSVRLTAPMPEEYEPLRKSYNDAAGGLADLIGGVRAATGAIRLQAGEIAQASDSLARRTEANAASIEETSAAMSQMDESVRSTAQAAAKTVTRADKARNAVADGRNITSDAVLAMERVSESAKGIDTVIEGLDKIAFQTRVLAMNAAVEAGRAGEAGRGFAVVADLVSALAMRSEEEAKRAREQLTTTQSEVISAVETVRKVDGALESITTEVDEVHQLLDGMAQDNRAQAQSISEVGNAISEMDRAVQQNAAMVEETTAAVRKLSGEIEALDEEAAHFVLDQGARHSVRADRAGGVQATLH
ncbi:MAG: methyl-accepting chemotaxis protein [Pseudomonadota bacterium]